VPPPVLVVDDQPDAREMLAEYLAFCGYDVLQAADGTQAIDLAIRTHPSVILMDLMMPRMDGWEATRRLKANTDTQAIAIAAVTACAHEPDQQRARAAGCDVVFVKPFDFDQIVAFIATTLDRRGHAS
jgi:CheY-like chemotaxis protein